MVLLPHQIGVQPIIIWDAAKQHTTPVVFTSARRLGLWPIIVPAKLTWLLQPLDTHVFSRFKRRLEEIHQATHVQSPSGVVAFPEFMGCVSRTIEDVVTNGSWRHAFEGDGFGRSQGGLSLRVKEHLGIQEPLSVSDECPSLDELAECFPARYRMTQNLASVATATPLPRFVRPAVGPIAAACARSPLSPADALVQKRWRCVV